MLNICPSCGRASLTIDARLGICEPCRRRRQLRAIEGRISDLMKRLPASERAIYEDTEAELEGRVIEPMPARPAVPARAPYYVAAKAEEDHAAAMELWEARRIKRAVKAAQKRKERVERKLKEL